MKLYSPVLLLSLAFIAAATGPVPVSRSGLAGVAGFYFYNPYCAHACFRSFAGFTLPCSKYISAGGHTTADMVAHNLAICRASNFPYLSSIAWCIHQFCPDSVKASLIEGFWETEITGEATILPKWSYGEVMANITQPPTMVAQAKMLILNETMITTQKDLDPVQNTLVYFFRETALESYFGLAICLTAFGLPILFTWLGYFPYMSGVLGRINIWLYPSLFKTYHDRPLPFLLGNVPTVGQGFYIALVGILNIIFLAAGYKTLYPDRVMNWYTDRYQELMAYVMWRTGVLAFCNMPVLFLFSSRNNILLWMTNWSHSTYMLLHRWIARIFLFQTLLHSIISLVLYKKTGAYAATLVTGWWIWGCVATVAAVIIVLTSFLIIRQRSYELFLVTHIVMSVIFVVGCWYHIWYQYYGTFGYETWLYATIAVWFVDRLLRLARILKTGMKRSKVTDLTPTIARVDIPGIRWSTPGRCVYVYFPTLRSLAPWESHPFSMIPTSILAGHHYGDHTESDSGNIEKNQTATVSSKALADNRAYTNSGVTLFVRKQSGMTGLLKPQANLLTLIEGPYPTNPTKATLQSDRLLLIGGGIGITGLLTYTSCHPNFKLFVGVKTIDEELVTSLQPMLDEIREKHIIVGARLDIEGLLREEANLGWSRVAVVVCGPASMCDDVRAVVAQLGKEKAGQCLFELEVDAFSW